MSAWELAGRLILLRFPESCFHGGPAWNSGLSAVLGSFKRSRR
jgi:hypothetical protein